jgi:DNA replication protein DnaC
LFTFLAERYETRSVMISSNLVFSQWDRIFKDPMTTAAAIDRLVHHCTILELTGQSYRAEAAKARGADDNYQGGNHSDSSLDSATPSQDIN